MKSTAKHKCLRILSAACVLLLAPVHFLFCLWRLLATVVAYAIWRDKAAIMTGLDAVFALEPNTSIRNGAVVSWIVLDGHVPLDKLRRQVAETLVENGQVTKNKFTYRRFRQRVSSFMGFYFWRDADVEFDICRHVDYHYHTPEKGPGGNGRGSVATRYATRADLPAVATAIGDERMFDMTAPPWAAYLVPKADDSEAVVFFRFHHSLMDATGQSVMFSELFQDKRVADGHGSQREFSRVAKLRNSLVALMDAPRFLAYQLLRSDDVNPLHSRTAMDGFDASRWIYWGENYPVASLKKFRTRLNASVNDVVMTAVSRGVRRYMELMYPRDDNRHWKLSVTQPVSLWTKGETTIRNNISLVTSSVPFQYRPHPGTQLEEVRRRMDETLRSSDPWAAGTILSTAFNTHPRPVLEAIASRVSLKATVLVSNALYSPVMPEGILDVGLVSPLANGQAVVFAICTAMNSMKMTVGADKAIFPTMEDVITLERLVREEFLHLVSLSLTDRTTSMTAKLMPSAKNADIA